MGARTSVRVWKGCRGLTSALVYAVLEWVLILLLFLDALFSYLVTKFAKFCELQTPCLLCSRIDHIIGCEKPGFYRNLICHAHKLEISSLAYCHAHKKLANVHDMCEGCLFSFAIENKLDAETYRSLVAKLLPHHMFHDGANHNVHPKLNVDADCSSIVLHGEKLVEDPLLKDAALESLGTRHCSCCNRPFRNTQQFNHRLVHFKSIAAGTSELDGTSSSRLMEHNFSHCRCGLKKRNRKSCGSVAVSNLGSQVFDPLSHIGYTELKITSDSGSEVSFSTDDDDDDGGAVVCEAGAENLDKCDRPVSGNTYQNVSHGNLSADGNAMGCEVGALDNENLDRCIHPQSGSIDQNVLPCNLSEEKFIDHDPVLESSVLVPQEQLIADEVLDISSSPSTLAVGHCLEELNWDQVGESVSLPSASETIPPPMPSSSVNAMMAPMEVNILDIDTACISSSENKEIMDMDSVPASAKADFDQTMTTEPGPSISNFMDLNEAYQLAIGNRGCQLSNSELHTSRDSAHIQEDLKVLLSQLSAARGFELSWNNMSPRVHADDGNLKVTSRSGSFGQQMLHKRVSIERNESGFESLDGTTVSEIEGESEVDRLKRQIALDRKSMSALYKELEEERSASAIAANQAMAMITRLQEEKAAMQMEALQYQRMMEEQAEYDQEALQKLNEFLAQKEKEMQVLEEELITYRRSQTESAAEKIVRPVTDTGEDCSHLPCYENNTSVSCSSTLIKSKGISGSDQILMVNGDYEGNKVGSPTDLLDFEDEKLHITKCLKRLEKMLHLFSNNGVHINISELDDRDDHLVAEFDKEGAVTLEDNVDRNGVFSQSVVHGGMMQLPCNGTTQKINEMGLEEEDLSLQTNFSPYEEDPHAKPSCNPQCITKNNHNKNCDGAHLTCGDPDVIDLQSEVLRLNERLVTLEADRNFLEHTINSLRNGDDGVQFIREIANHLRELRKIGITRKQQHSA